MFFYETEHIEISTRGISERISLGDIPYVELENRFPGYYDWYAEEKEDHVDIYRMSSELFFEARDGNGMTNYEYYSHFYLLKGSTKDRRLIKREYCYELVRRFYESKYNKMNIQINLLDIDIDYEIDQFFSGVEDWGKLRWGD